MTSQTLDEAEQDKRRVASTFDAASDHFDDGANSFLVHFGRQTVELLAPAPGAHVLDCACGTGHSSIPAALAVGPAGRVLGLDLSAGLLEQARAKAGSLRLTNLELRVADMEHAELPAEQFDAVLCVFGIFFVPDMEGLVRRFWSLVKPGGTLAITTWAQRLFEPAHTGIWLPQMELERPDLIDVFEPWDRIKTPAGLRGVLEAGGVAGAEIIASDCQAILRSPEDWWTMVIGLGGRWAVDQLDAPTRERVRRANLAWIREHDIRGIEVNVLYATARKPAVARGASAGQI
jgi:ubiquinone/menaquinone biosynthesis C-methylase UbiE